MNQKMFITDNKKRRETALLFLRKEAIFIKVVVIFVLCIAGYILYVGFSSIRIADSIFLEAEKKSFSQIEENKTYKVLSYNIGFGAFCDEYSFFMDGGEHSRALSKESTEKNINGILKNINEISPEIIFLQEVDEKADRSFHINERKFFEKAFGDYNTVFAINLHTPYFLYPLNEPIGKSLSGIQSFSKFPIYEAERKSLSVEKGIKRFFELDRCFQVSRIRIKDDIDLVLYNVHLSAYADSREVEEKQFYELFSHMEKEYSEGNFIICGGDFNKDLLGDSSKFNSGIGGEYSWARPFPFDKIPNGFKLFSDKTVPSNRIADAPYEKGKTFVNTIDGFVVSDNIEVINIKTIDTGFKFSDHNPVVLEFKVK